MSTMDGFARFIRLRFGIPCLVSVLLLPYGSPAIAAMQLTVPIKFESKQESNKTDNQEIRLKPDQDSAADAVILQQEVRQLVATAKELREAQERIEARISAIERRLNSPTVSDSASATTNGHRLWRSVQGKTILATLNEVGPDYVVLTRNGKKATIPLKQLCSADREHVAQHAKILPEKDLQRADIRELGVIR